jgi:hypothetical protein
MNKKNKTGFAVILFLIFNLCSFIQGQKLPEPDIRDGSYGPFELNKFDFYKAESDVSTPLVIYIHGGGFTSGTKSKVPEKMFAGLLKAGISVMSIDYRLTPEVVFPQHFLDCARAIQFARYHADQLNIDVTKVGASGSSAGACTALWIAFNDDLADKNSKDSVLHKSSRLKCVAVTSAQTTLDPRVIKEIIGETAMKHSFMKGGFFGITSEIMKSENSEKLFEAASPVTYLSKDDPPVWAYYNYVEEPKNVSEAIHHINFGIYLKESMDKLGLECIIRKPGDVKSFTDESICFLINHLLDSKIDN